MVGRIDGGPYPKPAHRNNWTVQIASQPNKHAITTTSAGQDTEPRFAYRLSGSELRKHATSRVNGLLTMLRELEANRKQPAGAMMHSLTFTCPQTGRAIDTGIDTDAHSLSSVQAAIIYLKCPYCGMSHQLSIKNGYLARPLYWSSSVRVMRQVVRTAHASVTPQPAGMT
jgi:hypothetical protein